MRGVYSPRGRLTRAGPGSSPHARGLPRSGCHVREDATDHPRMRGVYRRMSSRVISSSGSSPHARGLHDRLGGLRRGPRIIPACAGFTPGAWSRTLASADHPRMRGVYSTSSAGTAAQGGSSPHARGLLAEGLRSWLAPRIIPACAGFTLRPRSLRPPRRDHPRMRGVYLLSSGSGVGIWGSSPHARGLPPGGRQPGGRARIIPACAGFTSHQSPFTAASPGSSPHARGLPGAVSHSCLSFRIIPACAGFTRTRGSPRAASGDHPRMRGVYTWRSLESQRSWSLPPPGFLHC